MATDKAQPTVPPIGVPEQSMPDVGSAAASGENASWWTSQGRTIPGPAQEVPVPHKWRSNTSEEIDRFKPVPVVGRLPWRWQYVTFSVLLLLSLLSLLSTASSLLSTPAAGGRGPQYVAVIDEAFHNGLAGKPVNVPAQTEALAGLDKELTGPSKQAWGGIKEIVVQLPQFQAEAKVVVPAAQQVHTIASNTRTAIQTPWRASGQAGEWASTDAVNFAQALAEWQYIEDISQRVAQGKSDIPNRLSEARQNIDQSLRVFAASEEAKLNTNLTQSWRALASGFISMRQPLDTMIGRAPQWNNFLGAYEMFRTQKGTLSQTGGVGGTGVPPNRNRLWLSGLFVVLSLVFLLWIGWKQQKWHILQSRLQFEQLHVGVEDMGRQLSEVADGNLRFKLQPTNAYFQPIADVVNGTVKRLRALVLNVQQTAQEATDAAQRATETTGMLVESSRAHIAEFSNNVDGILDLAHGMRDIADHSSETVELADITQQSMVVGQQAVEDTQEQVMFVREKSKESLARAHRLHRALGEVQSITSFLNEVSDQMVIVSIQAAIQATKAGEAGQGFRVVADALKTLSEKSSEGSRRVGSLVETTLLEIGAFEETMDSIIGATDEGSRLAEVSMESALLVRENLNQVKDSVEHIKSRSSHHAETSQLLSDRTSRGKTEVEEQNQRAQDAAEAVLGLIDSVRGLNQSTLKFKV